MTMCLGVPGRVIRWIVREGPLAQAEIEFGGVRRPCHMACVTDAREDDYVLVHAGVAIALINVDQARRIFEELARLGDDDGWSTAADQESLPK